MSQLAMRFSASRVKPKLIYRPPPSSLALFRAILPPVISKLPTPVVAMPPPLVALLLLISPPSMAKPAAGALLTQTPPP